MTADPKQAAAFAAIHAAGLLLDAMGVRPEVIAGALFSESVQRFRKLGFNSDQIDSLFSSALADEKAQERAGC